MKSGKISEIFEVRIINLGSVIKELHDPVGNNYKRLE